MQWKLIDRVTGHSVRISASVKVWAWPILAVAGLLLLIGIWLLLPWKRLKGITRKRKGSSVAFDQPLYEDNDRRVTGRQQFEDAAELRLKPGTGRAAAEGPSANDQ